MLSDFSLGFVEHVFDGLGDIVYCVKDQAGVYRSVNLAFVARVNGTDKSDLLGKTASQVFSKTLAEGYEQQDRVVFQTGRPIQDQLERITNSDGSIGWYLASKFPIHDRDEMVVGLVGISQDLNWPNDGNPELAELKAVVEYIKDNLDQSLKTEHLARQISLSTVQLDRRMKRVFRLSTKKFIMTVTGKPIAIMMAIMLRYFTWPLKCLIGKAAKGFKMFLKMVTFRLNLNLTGA